MSFLSRYVLSLPDMTCHHCVSRITKVLEGEGLTAYRVLLEGKTVEIETEDVDAVLRSLDDAGYPGTIQEGPA